VIQVRAFCAAVISLFAVLMFAPAAQADFASSLARFAQDEFSETALAIDEIAASGDSRAQQVLEALGSARLFVDPASKKVYWRAATSARTIHDAANGEPVVDPPAGLQVVRINNRLRGATLNAIGALTLMAPDPARRRAAAESIFKSRDASALAPLEAAIKVEKDPSIATLFAQARADACGPSGHERSAARSYQHSAHARRYWRHCSAALH